MVPPLSPFRSLGALRQLNVLAVGLALAAVTSMVFGHLVGPDSFGLSAFVTGLPTLVVGSLWARLLRWRATIGTTRIRRGWALSVPLAMLNAGLAAGILVSHGGGAGQLASFVGGFVLGATVGAMAWVPALLLTLLLFGLPIAWAERLAQRGLAGEERGEWLIGLSTSALSLIGLVGALHFYLQRTALEAASQVAGRGLLTGQNLLGIQLMGALGLLGLLAGATTTTLAGLRERRRRRFVRDAEAGVLPGYRVDASPEGKVLVRVASPDESYRAAELEEEVFALDEQGLARAPLQANLDPPSRAG